MKPSPRTIRRPTAETHEHDQIVILIPEPHVLRVMARSVLLAAVILSFPWLHTMLVLGGGPPPADESDPKWVDNPFMLPMLVADLKREGLFSAKLRNVFLGDPGSRVLFLKKNKMDLMMSEYKKLMIEDNSVDFVLAANGLRDSSFTFVDRVLKVGGIVTVRLGSDPSRAFHLPSNYRIAYIRRFGSTIVAIKKISHRNAGDFEGCLSSRRLLSLVKLKDKQQKKTMYLQELMGDGSLDVHLFEMARFAFVEGVKGRMMKWLEGNAKGKEFVMMKAEAEAEAEAEVMGQTKKKGMVSDLVDEMGFTNGSVVLHGKG